MPSLEDLCRVPGGTIRNFTIELTSRCNLRCLYCSVPQQVTYGAQDIERSRLMHILKLLHGNPVSGLSLSGRGELTTMAGWEEICSQMQGYGVSLHTVINLAAPLSWKQAEILSRFQELSVSIDSADREVMKDIRKGADLRTILHNVALIRAAAFAAARRPPALSVIAVATAGMFRDIRPLAGLVAAIGATGLILQDLVMDYSDGDAQSPARPVGFMTQEELREAGRNLVEAGSILAREKAFLTIWQSLVDIVNDALAGKTTEIASIEIDSPLLGRYHRHAPALGEGSTRMCTDPWSFLILLADGKVQPCCGAYESVADHFGAISLDELVNAAPLVELRRRLLTGELDGYCRVCSKAPACDPALLRAEVGRRVERAGTGRTD